MKGTFICIGLLLILSIGPASPAKFEIFMQSMKCDSNPDVVLNLTCKLRPVRGKCGLILIDGTFAKHVPTMLGRFKLFLKYTGGFQPYLLDFEFNVCDVMAHKSPLWNNKVGVLGLQVMKDISPSLFTGCPYEGRYTSKWFDLNATLSPLLPPIIPAGVFRVWYHFHMPPNVSIFTIQADALVKATKEFRSMDFSLLNMALYTSLTKEDAAHYFPVPASLPKFSTQPLINYLTSWSLPALPTLNLIGWLPAFFTSDKKPSQSLRNSLQGSFMDDSSMDKILAHIDAYIDKIVAEKVQEKHASSQQEVIRAVLNDNRLLLFVRNVVKESHVVQKYELTDVDVEKIAEKVKIYLMSYLSDMQNTIRKENGVEMGKLIGRMGEVRQGTDPNIDAIVEKLLDSTEFSDWLLTYLSNWEKDGRAIHNDEIKILKKELEALRIALKNEIETRNGLKGFLLQLETGQKNLRANMESADIKLKMDLDTLLNDLNIRVTKLETSQDSYIDERVRKQLLLVFEHPGDSTDLLLWIKSIFVTKDYLEQRLNALNKAKDAQLKLELDRLGGSLLDEILVKVRNEMTSLNVKHSVSEIDESLIVRVVRSILAVYDADKTGLPDYALETAGGQVISTRCTQFYQRRTAQISIFGIPLWYQSSTPRIAITPSVHPGQCWAFTGFPGYLVIQLSRLIHVTGFTVEHIPKTLAPNGTIDSAPKDFVVMGLTHEYDKEPAIFGTYEYKIDATAEPLQYFPVQNKTIVVPYEFVEMRIDTNHGNKNYTCLYRIRVHGIPLP